MEFSISSLDRVVGPKHDRGLALSRRWLDFLRAVYSFEFLAVHGHGLILPFATIHDIYGPRLVAVPFTDYLAIDVDETTIAAAGQFLSGRYPDCAVTLRLGGEFRRLESAGYAVIRHAFCHRLTFTGSVEQLWNATEHSFRKNVQKAQRAGVSVRTMNDECGLMAFYDMLTRLRRTKFHALPHSRRHYAYLLETFVHAGHGNLWIARVQNKIIAAAFVLHSDGWLIDKMGVSHSDFLELCPNNLLLWEIVKFGVAHGMAGLDMGLTPGENAGLKRFKETLGCVATPITYYRRNPVGYDDARDKAIREMLAGVTAAFVRTDVPDDATHAAAEVLYRYFC